MTEEPDFAPSEQASLSVDALVNDTESDTNLPPFGISHVFEPTRRATPTIPPGFSVPSTPRTLSRPLSRNASVITPAVPVIPATPMRASTPAKGKKEKAQKETSSEQTITPAKKEPVPVEIAEPAAAAATPSKAGEVSTGKASGRTDTPKKKGAESGAALQENKATSSKRIEDAKTPKSTPKGKKANTDIPSDKDKQPTPAEGGAERQANESPRTTGSSTKRQAPGKLDISAATKLPTSDQADISSASGALRELQPKNPRTVTLASASSVPTSPAATSTGSPVKRSAPRTIRVLPTPKTEVPPPLSATSATSLPQVPTVEKLRSRQASIASVNLPGTPASELISDNASITSTSVSRASSPPLVPGKVGSAPVRKKTKAQAKKERQERARQIAEEQAMVMEDAVKSSDAEPVQEAIIGRKKKTKKPGASSGPAKAVNTQSVPASPVPGTPDKTDGESSKAKASVAAASKNAGKKAAAEKPSVASPRKPQPSPPVEEKPAPKPELTAQSIIADLQRAEELFASTLEFFKPLASSLSHSSRSTTSPSTDPSAPPTPPDFKIQFSEADLDNLSKKKPVRAGKGNGKANSNTLITPEGKILWGLNAELEERALQLEKLIAECPVGAKWRPRGKQHHGSHMKSAQAAKVGSEILPALAAALKEAGGKLAKHSQALSQAQAQAQQAFAQASSSKSQSLGPKMSMPTQKEIDDALVYLNQWVLPPTDPQNANAARTESFSVGGHPSQSANASAKATAHNLAAAAKAVAEGRAPPSSIPIQDIENLGVFAKETELGGYVVKGLEALAGAGLGLEGFPEEVWRRGTMGPDGRGRLLSMEEAEQALQMARKEHEALEKRVNAQRKRNRKVWDAAVGEVGK